TSSWIGRRRYGVNPALSSRISAAAVMSRDVDWTQLWDKYPLATNVLVLVWIEVSFSSPTGVTDSTVGRSNCFPPTIAAPSNTSLARGMNSLGRRIPRVRIMSVVPAIEQVSVGDVELGALL